MTKEEIEELRFLLILSKMKENDKLADVLADVPAGVVQQTVPEVAEDWHI